MTELCKLCETDPAAQQHHIQPKCKGGKYGETVWCCDDCGGQVHMLFDNKALAKMSLEELLETPKMRDYLNWKKKHPGGHRHRMSAPLKQWRKGHR